MPGADYLSTTSVVPARAGTIISDGTLMVSFSAAADVVPVGNGWSTWSSPPMSESSAPIVMPFWDTPAVTMTLSRPVQTFGFELEPDPYEEVPYTVSFFAGNTLLQTLSATVDGYYGARLFAVQSPGAGITRVTVQGNGGSWPGFAIAQVRYARPLTLTASAPEVDVGESVTFTGHVQPDGASYEVLRWTWKPDSAPSTIPGGPLAARLPGGAPTLPAGPRAAPSMELTPSDSAAWADADTVRYEYSGSSAPPEPLMEFTLFG